jgi:hypothetical protein
MMKPSFKLALLTFSILQVSPTVLAQSYSGTVGDLNTIFDPPMNINGTLCDVNVNTGNEHAYKACSDGVSAARWMAEKYAKNTGKYLGCLDGFYQGVTDGYSANINPTQEMNAQAKAFVAGAKMQSAEERAYKQAVAAGQTESADQIIARYRAVIGLRNNQGQQVLPNKDYSFPDTSAFKGYDDGYDVDVLKTTGSDFESTYATGWVNANSSLEDRIVARKAMQLQKEYANTLCNQTDTIFGRRGMPIVSIWDFFKANRQVNFQNYGWRNPDWAWEIFDRDERTLEQYQSFSRLKTLEKTVTRSVNITEKVIKTDAAGNPIRKLNPDGTPAVDGSGKPVFEYEDKIIGSKLETTREKLSDAEVQALVNIYVNGFKQAYDRFYARQYASINYNTEAVEKYKVAKIIGGAMASDAAGHIARRDAYNAKYKMDSVAKYSAKVKELYTASFDHLIDIFENNSVVELNEAEIIGTIMDSIFRPGEELAIQLAVTNLGEKVAPTSVNFVSTQDVQGSAAGFSFSAPALTRSNYVSQAIGRVSDKFEARSTVNVDMAIRNPGDLAEVAKSLIVRKQKTLTLNDYTEVDSVNGSLNFLEGSLSLVANIKNPAKNVASPIAIVETSVGNLGFVDKNIEPIAPGASRPVAMDITGMDPLALIITGSVSGSVNARIGNKIVHHQNISYTIGMNRSDALTVYHDALVTKRASNTGKEGMADRVAKLQGMLEELVKGDIERNVLWKKGEEVSGTIIAIIQRVYDDAKRAGRIDKDAQASYDELGKVLARNVKNVRNGGGIRLAKPNKENFLKEIGKFAKISTKLKEWDSKR